MLRMVALAALTALAVLGGEREAATLTGAQPYAIFEAEKGRVAFTRTERAGGLIEVAATVTPVDGQVRTVRLQMYDGESVTLAIPGHDRMKFRVVRDGAEVVARLRG